MLLSLTSAVKASEDIKNPSFVIEKSRDEYMLSECHKPVWFVIELCDTVKIIRFETDNYELYSGGPKLLSVSVSDKYSSRRADWRHVGNFTVAAAKKTPATFGDLAAAAVFARFVWVEVLENYDEEHYCTMTSFRVFGISEYEYLLEDDVNSSSSSSAHSTRYLGTVR